MTDWTPISDTLPPEKTFVVVTCMSAKGHYKRIPVTAYHHGDSVFETVNWYSSDVADNITHWMLLPKSIYKEALP